MEYRTLPQGGEKIGVIGMGASVIGARPEGEIIDTVRAACESGINYFDLAAGHATVFPAYGKALADLRKSVYLQIHFGADYTGGEYGWTTKRPRSRSLSPGSCRTSGRTTSTSASSTAWMRRAISPPTRKTASWIMSGT